jgi:hypothetical protein
MVDRSLLGTLGLCGLGDETWAAWHAAAKALTAQSMTADEQRLYETCTGRTTPPREPVREALFVVGRRGGKSRFAAAVGVHAASQHYPQRAPGERAIVGIAASDREQARVVHGYTVAPFSKHATLKPLVAHRSRWQAMRALVTRETRWGLDLATGVSVEVSTANFRRIRGRTFATAVCDEVAFWQDETGASPAGEILTAIRPALATLGGPLILITTPYAKRGVVWDLYSKFYGVNDAPVLVWKAPSRTMNPLLDERIIAEAYERDEAAAAAEYGAQFRDDVASFVTAEALRRVVVSGRTELPPMPNECDHVAFTDPAGGSGSDSFTLAIGHGEVDDTERVIAVLDCVREVRPPFSPEAVVQEFAAMLDAYRITEVHGDAYAGTWPSEAFQRAGIRYRVSAKSRSEVYRDFLPALNSQRIELLDHQRLLNQLGGLERRIGPSGRDTIDHGARGHDDVANAACGALGLVIDAAARPPLTITTMEW